MRNYLFDRPVGGLPSQPQPTSATIYTPKTKKRRRSPLPWILVFAAVILSLAATLAILHFGNGIMPWDSVADYFDSTPDHPPRG